jgi:hypothetical protein
MKKSVSVFNTITNKKFGPQAFYNGNGETDAEVQERLDSWVEVCQEKAKNGRGWGWAAREIPKDEMKDKWLPILIEEFEKPINIDGSETETWCRLDKEYTITITDLTAEHDAERALAQAEYDDRAADLQACRNALAQIDSWNSLQDIPLPFLKRFFKRLIKELKDLQPPTT